MSKYSGRRRKRKSERKKRIVFGPPLPSSYVLPRSTIKHHCVRLCLDQQVNCTGKQSSNLTPAPLDVMERKGKKSKRMRPWRKQEEGISQLIPGLKKNESFLGCPTRRLGMEFYTKRKRISAVQCNDRETMFIPTKHVPLLIVSL